MCVDPYDNSYKPRETLMTTASSTEFEFQWSHLGQHGPLGPPGPPGPLGPHIKEGMILYAKRDVLKCLVKAHRPRIHLNKNDALSRSHFSGMLRRDCHNFGHRFHTLCTQPVHASL